MNGRWAGDGEAVGSYFSCGFKEEMTESRHGAGAGAGVSGIETVSGKVNPERSEAA